MRTIIHTEASLGWGGQEIRILGESSCMKRRGHRVVIIAEQESMLLGKAAEAGFETVALSFKKKDYPASFLKLLKLIKRLQPDVINTHSSRDSWLAGCAAKASGASPALIRTRHLSTPVSKSYASSIVYGRLPDMIITTAESIREALIRRNGVRPDKVVSIPTGVDLSGFDPERLKGGLREELGLEPSTPLVGMVSVIRSWKGHDYFVEAAQIARAAQPETRFVIAGDGPRREAVARLIDEKGLSGTVIMLGHRDDVPRVMASLDILAQPSYGNEGVPQTVLQALAMGLAVVSSDLPPLLEVIEDGVTGLVAPSRDAAALAERITTLIKDEPLRKRLGATGREMVRRRFSAEKMADDVEEVYDRVCGLKGR